MFNAFLFTEKDKERILVEASEQREERNGHPRRGPTAGGGMPLHLIRGGWG